MLGFEVFDAGILRRMGLESWLDIPGTTGHLSSATTTTTADGHLVFWEELSGDPGLRSSTKACCEIAAACCGENDILTDALLMHVLYREIEYLGSYVRVVEFTYTTEKAADVFGNWKDQPPGYAIFTIVSNHRTLERISDKWTSFLSRLGDNVRSGLYVTLSKNAIQMRFFCEEVRIEDVIDFYVAGAIAIEKQQNGIMIVGQTYTEAVASSEKSAPYMGNLSLPDYWNRKIEMVNINVEEKFGPFERRV
jgi:hypothetical protein